MTEPLSKSPVKICKYQQYIQPNFKNTSYDNGYSHKAKKVSLHKHRLSGLLNTSQLNLSNQVSADTMRNKQYQNVKQNFTYNNIQISQQLKSITLAKDDPNLSCTINGTLFRRNIQKVQKQKPQHFRLQKIQPKSVTIKFQQVLDSIPNNRTAIKQNLNIKTKTVSPFKVFEMAENKFYLELISQNKKQAQKIKQKLKQNNSSSSTIDSLFNVRSIKMISKLSQTSPIKQQFMLSNQNNKNNQSQLNQQKKHEKEKRKYMKMFKNQTDISVQYQKQNPILKQSMYRKHSLKLSLKQLRKMQQLQSSPKVIKRKSQRHELLPLNQIKNKQPNNQASTQKPLRNRSMIEQLSESCNYQGQMQRNLSKNRKNSKQFTPMVFSLNQQQYFSSVMSYSKAFDNKFLINKKCDIVFEQKINKYRNMLRKTAQINNMQIIFPQSYSRNQFNFYVGKGNNSKLVKQSLKKRWWLGSCQDKKDVLKNNVIWTQLKDKSYFNNHISCQIIDNPNNKCISIHNHFQQNQFLGNKKALYYNMKAYYQSINLDVFDYLPLTFHITKQSDESYKRFVQTYNKFKQADPNGKNTWILKPGQNSNRGNGITVHQQIQSILSIIGKCQKQGRTYILQKYIQKPFLYNKRKFDIRCYMLLTRLNGKIKGYWYNQGYIRTSGYEFTLNDCQNSFIHLTNDAIQQHCDNYGKFQDKNKLSYQTFQKYLDLNYNASKTQQNRLDFQAQILPKLKKVCIDSIKASYKCLGKWKSSAPTFQLFGLDFMIDQSFNPWLIQINTNPCLQTQGRVLQKVIIPLVDNVLKLSVDCLFPPPLNWSNSNKHLLSKYVDNNKFEMVFDQIQQNQGSDKTSNIKQLPLDKIGQIDEDNDVYQE